MKRRYCKIVTNNSYVPNMEVELGPRDGRPNRAWLDELARAIRDAQGFTKGNLYVPFHSIACIEYREEETE